MLFMVPGAQAFDWDRSYVGGVVGVVSSTGSIDWLFDNDFFEYTETGTFNFSGIGLLAGVTSGINYTLGDNLVVGVEGDTSIAWMHNSGVDDEDYYYGEFDERLEALLTLRGRIGKLTDDQKTLFYSTAGLAVGLVSASAYLEDDTPGVYEAAEISGLAIGVIGGVGVEHAIKEDVTVKAELLGYILGSLDGTGYAGKGESSATYNPSGIIFRTGINFHF
jgi:opacity protein-like surface antigen